MKPKEVKEVLKPGEAKEEVLRPEEAEEEAKVVKGETQEERRDALRPREAQNGQEARTEYVDVEAKIGGVGVLGRWLTRHVKLVEEKVEVELQIRHRGLR